MNKLALKDNRLVNYVRSSYSELKKVTWPTPKETKNHTILVIVISLAVAAFLGAVDFVFSWGFEQLIKLKG